MKSSIKIISLMICLITFPACEFGSSPDLSKLQEMEAADTSVQECDEACQNFYAMIEQKYGADWEKACDENCINSEYDTFLKSSATPEETKTETQASEFKFSEECDDTCQSVFNTYLKYTYGDSCDAACKKAEFDSFSEWYFSMDVSQAKEPVVAEVPEVIETPTAAEQAKPSEDILPQKQPPAIMPLPPIPHVNPDEVNVLMAKIGFAPDMIVLLTPQFHPPEIAVIQKDVILTPEQKIIMDILPTLMIKAKYLLLAAKKDATNPFLMLISPDAETNRAIETVILKTYQATSPSRGVLKIGDNIGIAKLPNTYIVGTPFSHVEAIFKGISPVRYSAYPPCLSALAGKTFDSFISWVASGEEFKSAEPYFLQKIFDILTPEQKGPNNASCWYKIK